MKNLQWLKKIALNSIMLFALLLVFAVVAYPCKCVKQTSSKYYKSADAVVLAKVIEVKNQSENLVEVKLEISNAWKSNISQIFTIIIAKTSCEYELKTGEEHLLYLKRFEGDKWTTSQCMGNFSKDKSKNIQKWLNTNGKKAEIT